MLGLAKVDGTVIASAGGAEITVAEASWFAGALRNPIVKALKGEAATNPATIVLAKPVMNKDRMTVAVLFAFVSLDNIVTAVQGPVGWPSKVVLASNDGRQFVAWENTDLPFARRVSSGSVAESRSGDRDGWITATAQAASRGAFPETGWSLTVARSKAEVDKRFGAITPKLWAGVLAIACLALLASAAWTAWLAAPLRALALFATAAAQGKKAVPVSETRFREASILSGALMRLWTSMQKQKAPATIRLVTAKTGAPGDGDLSFDELVLEINELMDKESQTQSEARPGNFRKDEAALT